MLEIGLNVFPVCITEYAVAEAADVEIVTMFT